MAHLLYILYRLLKLLATWNTVFIPCTVTTNPFTITSSRYTRSTSQIKFFSIWPLKVNAFFYFQCAFLLNFSIISCLLTGQDASMVNYEIRFALKLCREIGLTEACVQLSAMLGLWESAVDLALSISKDLAKQTVQMASQSPTNNVELCKKLWLKIGKILVFRVLSKS